VTVSSPSVTKTIQQSLLNQQHEVEREQEAEKVLAEAEKLLDKIGEEGAYIHKKTKS